MFSPAYENWLPRMLNRPFVCVFSLLFFLLDAGTSIAQPSVLRVGLSNIPPSLGNPYSSMGPPSSHFWGSLYDTLTEVSENGDVAPSLALDWNQTQPTRWVFSLRSNIEFHNGAPFNAQAVITTLAYLQSDEAARFLLSNEVKNIVGVNALSDHSIEILTREPDAILPRRLSLIKIIEPDLWTNLGPEQYAIDPVGTGPYSFVEWGNGNSSMTLAAYEYARRSVKGAKTLVITKVPNAISREQALLSGELDIIEAVSPDSVETIRRVGFNVQVHPLSQILSIALPNVDRENSPLNSAAVRQALNLAVDRPAIAKYIFGGLVEVASQGALNGTVGFNPELEPYPYDPDEARRLIADAGYPNGFPLTIGVLQSEGTGQEVAYQKVGQDLNAIGIAAQVRAIQGQEFLRRFMSNDWGNYDAFSLLWNNEPMRDVGRALEYYSCLRPQPFFCDEAVTDAIRASQTEVDPQKRDEALRQIMARIQDLAPAIWLTNTAQITASNPNLTGIKMGPAGLAFEDMVFSRE